MHHKLLDFFKLVILYALSLVLGTVLYVASFWINFIDTQSIPLVGSIAVLLIVCLIVLIILLIIRKLESFKKILTCRDIAIIILILFCFNYNLYGMIPFNCARSNSIIMVGYLYKNNGIPKTEKEIQDFVEREYFHKYQAIKKRLQEQINAGNVKEIDGGYVLTQRGILVVRFFGLITDIYNMNQNFTTL